MINDFKKGDVLSETSHYIVLDKESNSSSIKVEHLESGDTVYIDSMYIKNYLDSADEVLEEIKVTKEDKKDGTLGIRSIWESIHSSQVFTVCFKKQDVPKSKKKYNEEIDNLAKMLSDEIDKTKIQKKGVSEAAKKFISYLINNPVLPYEEGEDRILRGYKIQFESRDGKYQCIDMDIEDSNNVRLVNINTIKWLIFNGKKYVVA